MRLFLTALKKELRLIWRDRYGLALWLTIPVTILALMQLTFGGRASGGPKPRGTLLVADLDGTLLSGMLGSAFSQGPLGELFTVEKVDEREGRSRMARGDGSALIIVPKAFQARILMDEPVTLTLITNPSQRILPAIAGQSLEMLSEGVHYLHLVTGDLLKQLARSQGAPSEAQVVAASIAFNRLGTELRAYFDPLLLDVAVEEKKQPEKTPTQAFNLGEYLFPGMLFMTFLFMARGSSDGLWEETMRGTLRRYYASGGDEFTFLGGRLAASSIVAGIVALMGLAAARWLLGTGVANWPASVAWCVAGSAVWNLLMLILQILAGTERAGEILTSFVIFPSMMLGGSMFPFVMMPQALASIGKATPLGWMVVRFDGILRGQATAADVGWGLAAMALAGLLLSLFGGWFLRRKFLQG
jgi:ABC-type multidrug transport system permease subunit